MEPGSEAGADGVSLSEKKNYFFVKGPVQKSQHRVFWDHFLFGIPTSQEPFGASTQPIFDRLDIFSDAIELKNTLLLLVLRHLAE